MNFKLKKESNMSVVVSLPPAGENAAKKYAHKSRQWYFEKALAAAARPATLSDWRIHTPSHIVISSGRITSVKDPCVLAYRHNYFFETAVYTFNASDSAAIRAQMIYWSMARRYRFYREDSSNGHA